ncbi:hypothetical protein ACFWXT_29635 [Bacillus cereus]|uniref:hypothetical protein n=1 Tax=Bacillus cereus TaxID=1396 RepID=UPI00366C0C65
MTIEEFIEARRPGKTGSEGRAWVVLEAPKPARVADRYLYWTDRPPVPSARCRYWARQIKRGWLPNRRLSAECYDCSAAWFGIYLWEYLHVLYPLIRERRQQAMGGSNS